METSPYDYLLSNAMSVLSGDHGAEILAGFSTQVGFLKEVCKNCLIDCYGCIEDCPHPECWPDETIMFSPTQERVALEGFVFGTGEDRGKMAGYLIVRDKKENKIYSRPCVITLPRDN
jgi:hypothetical protein